jgi:hypothetical protein
VTNCLIRIAASCWSTKAKVRPTRSDKLRPLTVPELNSCRQSNDSTSNSGIPASSRVRGSEGQNESSFRIDGSTSSIKQAVSRRVGFFGMIGT